MYNYNMPVLYGGSYQELAFRFSKNPAERAPKATRRFVLDSVAFEYGKVEVGDFKYDKYDHFEFVFRNCEFRHYPSVGTVGPTKVKFVHCRFFDSVAVSDAETATFVDCDFQGSVSASRVRRLILHNCGSHPYYAFGATRYHTNLYTYGCDSVLVSQSRDWMEISVRDYKAVSVADSSVKSLYMLQSTYDRYHGSTVSLHAAKAGQVSIGNSFVSIRLDRSSVDKLDFNKSGIDFISSRESYVTTRVTASESCCRSDKCSLDDLRNALAAVPTFPYASRNFPKTPFTMYKKARVYLKLGPFLIPKKTVIVTLQVPESAERRYSQESKKIRVSEAKVVAFSEVVKFPYTVRSYHYKDFPYVLGKTVVPANGFDSSTETCSGGIHGFLHIQDAESY